MLTLNLVSQELKERIKTRHIYLLIKKALFIIIIFIIVISIILLAAKIILQNNFNKVVSQTTLVTGSNKTYSNKVREINSQIDSLYIIQSEYIAWSKMLELISKITPVGASLSYLKININDYSMIIKGMSDTRNNLLAFKKNLENTQYLENIESPIENILQKDNINFEFNIKLNKDSLYSLN